MIKETIRKAIIAGTAAAALLTGSDTMVYAKNETLTENVVSQIVYVLDTNTGEVVTERNSEERMYPASMTKMMTVLVGLEHLNNMDETIRITDEMLAGLVEANASTAGFAEGDMPTVRDILYGSAIPSGADASNAIAFTCAGSIDGFVEMMNQKAQEIGMSGTHFTNPTGLHDDNHYSTAKDIAKLLQYGLQNDTFREIFSAHTYTTSELYSHPSGLTFTSTIWGVVDLYGFELPGMVGGKTGFTYEAGHCLAYWAEINDMNLIAVTALADTPMEEPTNIEDASTLLSELSGWNTFRLTNTDTVIKTIKVKHMWSEEELQVLSPADIVMDLPSDSQITSEITLPDEVHSTRTETQVTGSYVIKNGDTVLYSEDMMVTIPKEPNLLARFFLWIGSLFQ